MTRSEIRRTVRLVVAERKHWHHPERAERERLAARIAKHVSKLKGTEKEQIQAIRKALAVAEASELRRRAYQLAVDHATTT